MTPHPVITSPDAATAEAVIFRLNPLAALSWRSFGDEWVVFDAASGQTHQMDALHAAVLTTFEQAPTHLRGLLERLRADFDVQPGAELPGSLRDIADRFTSLGLIEPTHA